MQGWLIAIIVIVVVLVLFVVFLYNSVIRLRNQIKNSWAQIDVQLKRRNDLIPNLIESVKGYMKHEKGVLTQVTKARTAFMNAKSMSDKAKADNMMSATLKSLFAVAENYPQLKANENFIQFQNRVSEIENQISDRREFYNDSVNTYNIRLEQIPYVFIGNMLHYTKKELFKVDETDKKDVKVNFS